MRTLLPLGLFHSVFIIPSFFPNMNGYGTLEPIYNYDAYSSIWRLLQEWWDIFLFLKNVITY